MKDVKRVIESLEKELVFFRLCDHMDAIPKMDNKDAKILRWRLYDAIELLKQLDPDTAVTPEKIYRWMAYVYDEPCNYSFDSIDVSDFMFENAEEWCRENCTDSYDKWHCWEKFFELMNKKGMLG